MCYKAVVQLINSSSANIVFEDIEFSLMCIKTWCIDVDWVMESVEYMITLSEIIWITDSEKYIQRSRFDYIAGLILKNWVLE